MKLPPFPVPKEDSRPRKNSWAPGDYYCKCLDCKETFIGDKRALTCADCAYAPVTSGIREGK